MNLGRRAASIIDFGITAGGFILLEMLTPDVGGLAGSLLEQLAEFIVAFALAVVTDVCLFSLPRVRVDWFVSRDQIAQEGPELRHRVDGIDKFLYKVEVTCRRPGLLDKKLMRRFLEKPRTVVMRIDPKGSVRLSREASKTHASAKVLTSSIRFPLDPAESDGVFAWATITMEPKNTPDNLEVRCIYEISPVDGILDRLVSCRGRVRAIRLVRS